MSDAAALPLFFTRVVGVNPGPHGALRLDRGAGYGFAAGSATIPLGLGEVALAARHYPVVFAGGPVPMPVALVGLDEGGNLFVGPDGAWVAGAYVPAYVRAWPFLVVEDPQRQATYVAMEEGAACLGTEAGEKLFEDGKPTRVLSEAAQFCAALRENLAAAASFARGLDEAGLLQEEEAQVTFTGGGSARVRGFRLVRQDRLDQVADETFLDWRRRGWLGPVYAHLHSAGNWARLVDLAVSRGGAGRGGAA
jgi:hypothetical protein